ALAQDADATTSGAAPADAAPADAGPTDAELAQFAAAMQTVQSVAATVQNGTPTEDQQAQMAAAVQNSGLAVERFNAISAAVSADPVLQARAAVAGAAPSAPGSVGEIGRASCRDRVGVAGDGGGGERRTDSEGA